MGMTFGGHDAAALEREYLPTHWPGVDVAKTVERRIGLSEAFHGRVEVRSDLAYGATPRQSLDLLLPDAKDPPVLAFIHGGYWRSPRFDKRNYSFCAEPIVRAGALVAMIEYDLCPNVSMDVLIGQAREACAWLYRNAERFGGGPRRLHVAGHSAGGHLAAMVAATDWASQGRDLPADIVKSIIPISGLFDLDILRFTPMNADLRLDEEAARRNSPSLLKPAWRLPASLVVGGGESGEFRRQSQDFISAWRGTTGSMDYLETPGHHHFAVIEAMTEPGNPLTATILRHLGF